MGTDLEEKGAVGGKPGKACDVWEEGRSRAGARWGCGLGRGQRVL